MQDKKKLSEMSLDELWHLFPIELRPHDERWNEFYLEMKAVIAHSLDGISYRMSHIGSTAISGIWAKPIVDILLEVENYDVCEEVSNRLSAIGFLVMSRGNGRITLNFGYTEDGFAEKVYHLHLRKFGDNNEIYFRDYISEHADVAKAYEELKLSLCKEYEFNRDGYTEAKSLFVKDYTNRAKLKNSKPRWIWVDDDTETVNRYAIFRTTFMLSSLPTESAYARVSVAGNYVMRINGDVVAFGQYTDYPSLKTYTETSLSGSLKEGENEVEIEVHFSGNRFSSHFDGTPGLWAEFLCDGEMVAVSSKEWFCAYDARYSQGDRTILFVSLNYTYDFDSAARLHEWGKAVELSDRGCPTLRPTSSVPDLGFKEAELLLKGDGYAVYDLGTERTGLFSINLSAMGGEVLEIVHGEYLLNGRVQDFTNVDNPKNRRSVVDTYRCRGGVQSFTHYLRRYGCRYIELRSSNLEAVNISSLGLRITEFPELTAPHFECSDKLLEKMNEISARTLRCCLHEKYENCPWREQSICEYDARNQMLFGYPVWGNYHHAAAMIRLYCGSETPYGFLTAIAPSASRTVIPAFTFSWLISIYEYTFYSGDFALFNELKEQIERIISKVLAIKEGKLYSIPVLNDYWVWNYCEPNELEFCNNPPNAFYNLYLREALLKMAILYKETGNDVLGERYEKLGMELGKDCEEAYWDENVGLYGNSVGDDGKRADFHGHIQALFLAQGLVPNEKVRRVIDAFQRSTVSMVELSALQYLVRGIFDNGAEGDKAWLHEKICSIYSGQIADGATTWYESLKGKTYGGGSGSLCHGWSAMPIWYIVHYILGYRPTGFGCKTFEIKPYKPNGMSFATGDVYTPQGVICLGWKR